MFLQSHLDRDGDFVLSAVNGEHSVYLQGRLARTSENAVGAIGMKCNFWEARAFDYIGVHLFIARAVASFAASGVENDLSAGLAAGWVVLDRAALGLKRAFDCVHVTDKSNFGIALRGVELQKNIVRRVRLSQEAVGQHNNQR